MQIERSRPLRAVNCPNLIASRSIETIHFNSAHSLHIQRCTGKAYLITAGRAGVLLNSPCDDSVAVWRTTQSRDVCVCMPFNVTTATNLAIAFQKEQTATLEVTEKRLSKTSGIEQLVFDMQADHIM